MARWSVLVVVHITCCLLVCCAGIVKVANERDGTDDVLFDSAEVLAINKLPVLLQKLREVAGVPVGEKAKWLRKYNREYENMVNKEALAGWAYATNITDENAAKSEEAVKEMIAWTAKEQPDARRYYYFFKRCDSGLAPCKPESITYALHVIVNTQSSASPQNVTLRDEMVHLGTQLQSIYSKAKLHKDGKEYKLEPELTKIMAESRDYNELLWAWTGWRNVTGRNMRALFDRFVQLQNMGAQDIGLDNMGTHWRIANYDMDEKLEDMVLGLFHQVAPLYRQLHAYVRRKLIRRYPGHGISATGPIPAHLLGNMWAQQWNDIYDLVIPFPEVAPIDVTETMKAQNYTPLKMFKEAERFYTSIGLQPMTETFWKKSMITRPTDREVVCHASADDFFKGDDYRIKMCTEVNQDDLTTIHHEMGHIEYFMQYRKQDPIFRSGANAAFHEAVGDTIALSVMTPGHLEKIGLLNSTQTSHSNSDMEYKREINFLMKMALEKIAFLPFGYLIDKYRWDVFRGNINKLNYNAKWWEYRLKYQGIAPPVDRTEEDFDPGAKYHVPANVPYMRYFLSFIGQFQFHKALCDAADRFGKLHECDIFNSTKAGTKLKKALSLGSSKPWPEVMKVLTGEENFSASSIKEYFRPLVTWLSKENESEQLGWEGEYTMRGTDDLFNEMERTDDAKVRELLKALSHAGDPEDSE